jgi:hypothetical protein
MADTPEPPPLVDAPEAKAQAQTGPAREPEVAPQPPLGARPSGSAECVPIGFVIADRVIAATVTKPHAHPRGEPLYRRLRIYALDPTISRLEGAVATLEVPFEPLARGPSGALFDVVDYDATRDRHYGPVDLEDPFLLMQDGRAPSASDPQFHQQMVYAVASRVYFSFKVALGRDLSWGFSGPARSRLRIRPHAFKRSNAFYDRCAGELAFGYYETDDKVPSPHLPHGTILTCVSHDIIAHETTHALLDGLRANFMVATGPDVLAFHEALADLVAIFLHFQYPDVVKAALKRCRGDLRKPTMLSDLAQQFGQTTGAGRALRYAIDELKPDADISMYDRSKTSHALGGVLVAAVYDAFVTVFKRKTALAIRLATNGTGLIPEGDLDADLLDTLAVEAKKLGKQFLTICVRAVDYCPSVDIELGEYLRAMVTADADLVPDDPWAYREALIEAFRRRAMYPAGVPNLSEEALRWEPASPSLAAIPELHFAELRFAGDPATAASAAELRRQACALGRALVKDENSREAFGLAAPGAKGVDEPRVESIRTLRRVGPDNQIVFDLVAEITQCRQVPLSQSGLTFTFFGGATVIIGPEGNVRHVIYKRSMNDKRVAIQQEFMSGQGRRYWEETEQRMKPVQVPFALLHGI